MRRFQILRFARTSLYRSTLQRLWPLDHILAQPSKLRGIQTLSKSPLFQDHDEFTRHDQAQEEAKARERQVYGLVRVQSLKFLTF